MTELNKPVKRLSLASKYSRGKARRIVVTLLPSAIAFRLHGERKQYQLPLADLYPLAVRVALAAEKQRRKAEREAKRKK